MDDPAEDAGLVAFDFDGTLTVRDSFTAFLRWRAGPRRYRRGMRRLTGASVAYAFDGNRGKLKAAAVREFLTGAPREELEAEARAFAEEQAAALLRPDALRTWRRWRSRRARLVIVTATPDLIVAPFARGLGADMLIGSQLAFDAEDRVTGALLGPNCRGAEKVTRLRQAFGDDVTLRAAYGDTKGDKDMLKLAEEKGYRIFKERP